MFNGYVNKTSGVLRISEGAIPSLSLPFPTPPLPTLPLEVGPLNPAIGRSPSRNRIWRILALKSDIWWQQF